MFVAIAVWQLGLAYPHPLRLRLLLQQVLHHCQREPSPSSSVAWARVLPLVELSVWTRIVWMVEGEAQVRRVSWVVRRQSGGSEVVVSEAI